MSNQDGGAVFPHRVEQRRAVGDNLLEVKPGDDPGISLRDYIAIKAMHVLMEKSGFLANPMYSAEAAYAMADAMLKAREVGQ